MLFKFFAMITNNQLTVLHYSLSFVSNIRLVYYHYYFIIYYLYYIFTVEQIFKHHVQKWVKITFDIFNPTCSVSREYMFKFVDIVCIVMCVQCIDHDHTIVCMFIPGPKFADFSFSHFYIFPASSRTSFPAFHIVDRFSIYIPLVISHVKLKSLTRTLQLGTAGERRVKSAISVSWYCTWIIMELWWAFIGEGLTL